MNRKALWMTIKPRIRLWFDSFMGIVFLLACFITHFAGLLFIHNNKEEFDLENLFFTFIIGFLSFMAAGALEFAYFAFIANSFENIGFYMKYSIFMSCVSLIYALITLTRVKLLRPLIEEYKENLKNVEERI